MGEKRHVPYLTGVHGDLGGSKGIIVPKDCSRC